MFEFVLQFFERVRERERKVTIGLIFVLIIYRLIALSLRRFRRLQSLGLCLCCSERLGDGFFFFFLIAALGSVSASLRVCSVRFGLSCGLNRIVNVLRDIVNSGKMY